MINQDFEKFVQNEMDSDCKTLLAVSGGVDSMVMMDMFYRRGLPIAIAHCNFKLRGEESDKDTEMVKAYAESLSIPLFCQYFDTELYAQQNNLSIEMAARELRYQWFNELAEKHGYPQIAVAHHRDDSLETFVLNWARGTGIRGLTGIKAKNLNVVRPLLTISRAEVVAYAKDHKIPFRHDSSNDSDAYLRNIVRHKVLPNIDRINSQARNNMQQSIDYLQQVEKVYDWAIEMAKKNVLSEVEGEVRIMKELLLSFVSPEQLLYELLYPYGFHPRQIHKILSSMEGSISGKEFYANNHRLRCERDFLVLEKGHEVLDKHSYSVDLNDDSIVSPIKMKIEKMNWNADSVIPRTKERVLLDVDAVDEQLILRRWEKGDRFKPLGMKGFKKLSDYFIDRKWTSKQKESCWILCNQKDIVWIVGERLDDRYKVTSTTKQVYSITLVGL